MRKFFKRIRSEPVASVALVLLIACFCIAGWSGFDSLRLTPKSTDTYTIDSRNTSGTTTFTVTPAGEAAITSMSGTGVISATNIADVTRSIHLDLLSAWLNGTGMLGNDGTTAPGVSTTGTDGIPAVVYASSAETASLGWSFAVPADYVGALAFRMLVSSSAATPASMSIDWEIWANRTEVVFDAAQFGQTAVSPTIDLTATNQVLTFTADATALAGIAAGDIVSVMFWNADTRVAASTTEIKGIEARYTATQ